MLRRRFLGLTLIIPGILQAVSSPKKEKLLNYKLHRSFERGEAEHGWLHSKFSFSFANYHNPDRMGFGVLRVINDDIVEAGMGFRMHPHENMEIISIVTKGALEHKDSFGNHGLINEGEIQYMSAGDGVFHSEFNPSKDERVAFFQIWILPHSYGGRPIYDKRDFSDFNQENQWVTLVSADPSDDAMTIKQDARIYATTLTESKQITTTSKGLKYGRLIFVIEGSIEIENETLEARDEMQIVDEHSYTITALEDSKLLMFEVPIDNKHI